MLNSYLKLAVRVLLRRKFFTFISLFSITLTLLVLLVVAAMMDHMLASAAPESRLDRLLFVPTAKLTGPRMQSNGAPGYGLLALTARDLPGVEKASFYTARRSVISYHKGEKIVSELRNADPAYWEILDFTFVEGGPLTAADEAAAEPVAVMTDSARRRFFGPGARALDQYIEVAGQRLRVKGVVRSVSSMHLAAYADIWVPLSAAPGDDWRHLLRANFNAMLLARDRAAFPAIRAEFSARVARLTMPHPELYDKASAAAVTRFEEVSREMASGDEMETAALRMTILIAVLGLGFMLLPTINRVNITISRIFERASEIGVRKAFGASSRQLIGQFVVENIVLSLIGGAIGLLGAAAVLAWLNGSGLIAEAAFRINLRVFFVALVLSIVFGILSGAYPAWRMSRLNPVSALKGGGA